MKTLKKRDKAVRTRDSKGNVITVGIVREETLAYARGADAPDEMRRARDPEWELNTHIERVITMGKDAHDAISVEDGEYGDEDAMHSLHDAASAAYKAIAILRRRSRRDD